MGRKVSARWIGAGGQKIDLLAVLFGLLRSTIVSLIGFVFLLISVAISKAEILYFSNFITLVLIVSILLGGLKAGKVAEKSGWLQGLIVAIIYLIILFAMGLMTFPQVYTIGEVFLGFSTLSLIGALGGIFGVNLKDHQKRQQLKTARLYEKYWGNNKK